MARKTTSTFTVGQSVRHRKPEFCRCIVEDDSVWESGTVTAVGVHQKGAATVTVAWGDGVEREFTSSFVVPVTG